MFLTVRAEFEFPTTNKSNLSVLSLLKFVHIKFAVSSYL